MTRHPRKRTEIHVPLTAHTRHMLLLWQAGGSTVRNLEADGRQRQKQTCTQDATPRHATPRNATASHRCTHSRLQGRRRGRQKRENLAQLRSARGRWRRGGSRQRVRPTRLRGRPIEACSRSLSGSFRRKERRGRRPTPRRCTGADNTPCGGPPRESR
jgi:hypothetical protein